jgi:uncharacterized protein (DUF1330 family)
MYVRRIAHRLISSVAALSMATVLAACGSDSPAVTDTSLTASSTVAASTAPTDAPMTVAATLPDTIEGRLALAYPDTSVDPSPEAWRALLDDDSLVDAPVGVIEFANVADASGRDGYSAFIDTVAAAAQQRGGSLVAVVDVWRAGLELPQGFDGGMAWAASFPSRDAFVDTMLDDAVVAASAGRRTAVIDPHLLLGVNLVPELILGLPVPDDVEALPHDLVRGRPTSDVIDELLTIYPDGGPDPTREVLEAMFGRPDVQTQAVTYVNLYRFDATDTGAGAITEYNEQALPFVLEHGARPRLVFDVAHQLLGSSTWNRAILVRWPSLEVFTNLRLTPGYVDAQVSRVTSSSAYGNLVTIDRADRP